MIWNDGQPSVNCNLKTVAILITKPDHLGTTGEQFVHRVRSADVVESVAHCFSDDGPKLLIGDQFVNTQVQQLFGMKGNLQGAKG